MRRGHRFRLDAQQLSDGVVSGSSSALRARLSSGAPITAVAIGASVALHGGCTDQPGSQCMLYRGVDVVDVGWGRRIRHKGFLVRWMDYINSTWPHPDHQLRNFASGGVARLRASRAAEVRERTMRVVYPSGEIAIDFLTRKLENSTPYKVRVDIAAELPDPLGAADEGFYAACLGLARSPVPAHGAVAAVAMAEAAEASALAKVGT